MEQENGFVVVPYRELSRTDQYTVHEVFGYLATEAAIQDVQCVVDDIDANMSNRRHLLWCLPGAHIGHLFNHDTGRGQYGELNIDTINLRNWPPQTEEEWAEKEVEDPKVWAYPAWAVLFYRVNKELIDSMFDYPGSRTECDSIRLDYGKLVRALENPSEELFTPMEDNFTTYPMPELTSDELNILYKFNEVYREVAVRMLEAIKKETVDRMKAIHESTDSAEFLEDFFSGFTAVKDMFTGSIVRVFDYWHSAEV